MGVIYLLCIKVSPFVHLPFHSSFMNESQQMGFQFPSTTRKLKIGAIVALVAVGVTMLYGRSFLYGGSSKVEEVSHKITEVNLEIANLKKDQEAKAKELADVEAKLYDKRQSLAGLQNELVAAQNEGLSDEFKNASYKIFNPVPEAQAEEVGK